MKSVDLVYIKDIVNKYGEDLHEFDLADKIFTNFDFSNIVLPDNVGLFQEAKDSNLNGSVFSNIDLSKYCLDGVCLSGVTFSKDVVLPDKRDLFQCIKDKDLSNVSLPLGNYSNYDFEGVSLMGTKFCKDSILNVDEDFFQRIKNKNLNFAVLPEGDYSECNFEGVSMYYTKFGKNSLIPKDYTLFKKITMLKNSSIVDQCIEDIHLYDLSDLPYNLKISGLDKMQSYLLYRRFIEDNPNSKVKLNDIF